MSDNYNPRRNQDITYTICIINNGPPVTISEVVDNFPNSWTSVGCNAQTDPTIGCDIGAVSPGGSVRWFSNFTVNTGQTLRLNVTGHYDLPAGTHVCNTTSDYTITKSDSSVVTGGNDVCVDIAP
jgi:hypothetical protein